VALEQLLAIRRSGADLILTYFAREVAEHLAATSGSASSRYQGS
jgi:delta-aminolevulinic acid dehydratase/porphobilinogen synthase